jgi:hypothetical protein
MRRNLIFLVLWQPKGGGLDIPSELSPVKESEPVPNRSVTGSFMNSVISRNWGGKS